MISSWTARTLASPAPIRPPRCSSAAILSIRSPSRTTVLSLPERSFHQHVAVIGSSCNRHHFARHPGHQYVPLTGSLGTLNIQSAATILLTVKPTASGLITNSASVGTDSLDSNSANNNLSIVATVWPLPFLSITNLMSNNLVQIKWPAPLSNFTLQFRTDLSSSVSWTNNTAPKIISGTNVTVIDTNVGTPKFFRLTN